MIGLDSEKSPWMPGEGVCNAPYKTMAKYQDVVLAQLIGVGEGSAPFYLARI